MKVVLQTGQKLWFTSDTHYHHANICSATTTWVDQATCREFDTLEKMDSTLVNNINELVDQDDILFHLGDWSFGGVERIKEFRDRISCRNIHLITGNHDHHIEKNDEDTQSLFSSISKYLELSVNGYHFVMMHFPIASWNNIARGSIHLHGHVHLPKFKRVGPGKMMDVGVDGNDYRPIELTDVISIMSTQPNKSMLQFDYHEKLEHHKHGKNNNAS